MHTLTRFAAAVIGGLAVVAVATGAGFAEDKKKIRIGTEGAYPPFNNLTSDGQLVGFDVDIAKALCEEMNAECEFVTQDWDGMIPALIAGKYDAIIASMSITPERMEKVDFTNKYYNTPPGVAVPKDSEMTEIDLDVLKGVKIGAQSATTHANYAEEIIGVEDLRRYPTPEEYKLDVANGRVDAVLDDIVVLSEWVNSPDGECCRILGTLTPDPEINGMGAGIAIRKGEDELRQSFNEAIDAIRANGTYEKINNAYFEFDVFGD